MAAANEFGIDQDRVNRLTEQLTRQLAARAIHAEHCIDQKPTNCEFCGEFGGCALCR